MKVELISYTPNPIQQMYLAATRCVTAGEVKPSDPETMKRVVEKCLNAGHLTVAEFVDFTFSIEGITRSCSHQLVRHRHASFCQMSERRVKIGADGGIEKFEQFLKNPNSTSCEQMAELLSKYFNLDSAILAGPLCICAFSNYLEMVQNGVPVEQARAVLPECTLTNLYMHVNLRSLIEMARLRLCTKSENEIRRLFAEIVTQVRRLGGKTIDPEGNFLATWLVPKCYHYGRCNELNGCGHIERIHKMEKEKESIENDIESTEAENE